MNEARQSEIRNRLYLKQLDFEKMYSLGSKPYINQLAAANNINWISGVEKSSQDAFQHNPVLTEEVRGKDSVVYSISLPTSLNAGKRHWRSRGHIRSSSRQFARIPGVRPTI